MDFFKCLKIKIKIILKNSKKSTFEFLNFFLINNQNKNENKQKQWELNPQPYI